jgi:hypothetical protein
MNPGVTKTHAFVSAPLPDRATVEWRTPDEMLHSKQVEVRSLVAARFTGTLRFEILPGDEVRVSVDKDESARLPGGSGG